MIPFLHYSHCLLQHSRNSWTPINSHTSWWRSVCQTVGVSIAIGNKTWDEFEIFQGEWCQLSASITIYVQGMHMQYKQAMESLTMKGYVKLTTRHSYDIKLHMESLSCVHCKNSLLVLRKGITTLSIRSVSAVNNPFRIIQASKCQNIKNKLFANFTEVGLADSSSRPTKTVWNNPLGIWHCINVASMSFPPSAVGMLLICCIYMYVISVKCSGNGVDTTWSPYHVSTII